MPDPSWQQIDQALEHCIWHAETDRMHSMPQGDPQSWAGSVHAQMLEFGRSPDLTARFGRHDAYLQAAVVMMVKDEADIIRSNLDWLYHVGLRHFAVIDNDSHDGTDEEIRRFARARAGVRLLLEHDEVIAHFQAEKTTRICRIALEEWPDLEWIIPVDADEFLNTRSGLRSLLFVPEEVDALTVPKVVHFQSRNAPANGSMFARMGVRSTPFAVPPKVILRASAGVSVAKGNHWVVRGDGQPARYVGGLSYGLFHREFQTRSFAQFLSKVRNGGRAVLAANALGREVGGQHWLRWHQLLMEGGEAALRAEYEQVAFREVGADYVVDLFVGSPVE